VLHKDEDTGQLTRMFMAEPRHTLHMNLNVMNSMSLGIHSHLYDIDLIRLVGNPINLIYQESETGIVTREYSFESLVTGGRGARYENKQSILRLVEYDQFRISSLSSDILHTIYVPESQRACWIVKEGLKVSTTNRLFNNMENMECIGHETFLPHLYVKDNPSNFIRSFVREFFDSTRNLH